LDLRLLCKQLLQAGWDAFASDLTGEVAARQDHLPNRGTWTLTIDRSGRWRFTATSEIGMADGRELVRGSHTWRLLKEKQQVLTIAGHLSSQDDLAELLVELTQLARQETSPTNPEAEGEPSWDEDHELRTEMSDL
jgi:hypothetical protein